MALGASPSASLPAGRKPSAPYGSDHLSFAGDDAYPSGGTLEFQAYARSALGGRGAELKAASGYGFTAGAWTHICRYDQATDALVVYQRSDGAEPAATTDLSSVTFEVDIIAE